MPVLANNKKALFNFEVLEKFEAGVSLQGWEVKSIKAGKLSLKEGYVVIKNNEAWLMSAYIGLWKQSDVQDSKYETRARKLLLSKREIRKLADGTNIKGNSIVPLKAYTKSKSLIKVEIALVKGKKQHDKRQKLKEKDMTRQINRDLKYMGY